MAAPSDPNFVVTGCARSGTGYTANLLAELGIPCGHEAVFTPYTKRFGGFDGARGDSSWLAVPFLDELPAGTVVFHQVRHPAAVVSSLLGIRFFADEGTQGSRDWRSRWQVARARGVRSILSNLMTSDGRARARRRRSDFVDFLRGHCPEVMTEPDEWSRAVRYWVEWNRLAARAADRDDLVYVTYRLEDIDAAQTAKLLAAINIAPDDGAIEAALQHLPQHTNTRPRAARPSEPAPALTQFPGVTELAASYGYDLSGS